MIVISGLPFIIFTAVKIQKIKIDPKMRKAFCNKYIFYKIRLKTELQAFISTQCLLP